MSYQWTSASTPQGRERLKELLDQGHRIVGKVGEFGRITAFWKHDNGYDVDAFLANDLWYHARAMDGIEFLDPSPSQPKDDAHLDLMRYILTLSDDVSASYIKGMIRENLKIV